MATGKSGYFDLSTTKSNVKARVNWSETYDITTNASAVRIDSVQVMAKSPYGYYGYTYYPDGTITIDGQTVVTFKSSTPSHSVRIAAQDTWYAISGAPYASGAVKHNTDGSGSTTIAVDITGYEPDGDGDSGWRASGSKTITLTTIPRASAIGATDANIGSTSIIAVNRKSTAYTHSIKYQFGDLSGYINADGEFVSSEAKMSATNIAVTLPASWYDQIPNDPSGECTLTCKTYSGSTQIGDAQTTTFTATASRSACKPSVSGTAEDTDEIAIGLTGDSGRVIRYISDVLCGITAAAKNGASIVEKSVNGSVISDDSLTIENADTNQFVFKATDSRGYSSTATVTLGLVEYVLPTAVASAVRDDPTSGAATLTLTGNYYNGSFGAEENELTIQYRVGSSGDWVTVSAENVAFTDSGYTAEIPLTGLDYAKQHRVYYAVSDKLTALGSKSTVLGRGIPVVHWGENDFTAEGLLRAAGGEVVVHPHSGELADETALEEWLDAMLSGMPDNSTTGVIIAVSKDVWTTNARFFCWLYKLDDNRAAIDGFTYGTSSARIHKRKYGGAWAAAAIQ